MTSYMPFLPRAGQKVTLCDLFDPSAKLSGLLNPETLRFSVDVAIGELQPVGWSHPVLMYGHTKAVKIPLEFYFLM